MFGRTSGRPSLVNPCDQVCRAYGIPWRGIADPSPEVEALGNPRMDLKKLPFDPLEYVEHLDQLPFDPALDPDFGQ